MDWVIFVQFLRFLKLELIFLREDILDNRIFFFLTFYFIYGVLLLLLRIEFAYLISDILIFLLNLISQCRSYVIDSSLRFDLFKLVSLFLHIKCS